MAFWLASERNGQATDWIQRFDPRFWTVNFPRPMMAATTTTAADALRVDCVFYRKSDLAGLIWESEDTLDHPLTAYQTKRDYRRLKLSFRWRSGGVIALDQVHGPTLTIEGRDGDGNFRAWYVRLWNYAQGDPEDAIVTLDFSRLEGGYFLPDDADPVLAEDIDRMFISLVAPGHDPNDDDALSSAVEGWAEVTAIVADGKDAMLEIGDVMVPPHDVGLCTAFDDSGVQSPARLLRNARALGYRGEIVHYLGMSHYYRLVHDGAGGYVVDPAAAAFNVAMEAWHRDYFSRCAAMGYAPIASLSYELLDQNCPADWKQRDLNGNRALTGWDPPSSLLSPANGAAMDYLQKAARAAVRIMLDSGNEVKFQVGEPWWWTFGDGRICLYDDDARAAFGGNPPAIATLDDLLDQAQRDLLDQAGALLAASTANLSATVRDEASPADAEVRLLTFTPTLLDPARPEARRANLPIGWAKPAFDRLQIEDYDWLTSGKTHLRREAYDTLMQRLGYAREDEDYFSGFVLLPQDASRMWPLIDAGLDEAATRGVTRRFVWAGPQVMRDGYVRLPLTEEDDMQAFDDISYPLALGRATAVAPQFSTNVMTTASGHERRNALWSDARLQFDVGPGIRSDEDLGELLEFFRARRGAARGFRLRDPSDFSSAAMTGAPSGFDQLLGLGDGAQTAFPLIKAYGSGADPQIRRITRPEAASIRVSVDGIETGEWTIEPLGIVRLDSAPAIGADVRAGFRFDVPVRFAEDRLAINGATFAAGEAPSVPLIEIRESA